MFFHFLAKIRKYKILGRGDFFENWQEYISQILCGLKILTKSFVPSRMVKDIEGNLCFAIFGKVAITQSVI